jgi:hypothetical protein
LERLFTVWGLPKLTRNLLFIDGKKSLAPGSFVRQVTATGERIHLFGEHPSGYLSYSADGRMYGLLHRTIASGRARRILATALSSSPTSGRLPLYGFEHRVRPPFGVKRPTKARAEEENAEVSPWRRCIQLTVPSDSDFCREVVRRLVPKPVRTPGPQSGWVYEQVCPACQQRHGQDPRVRALPQ